MTLATQGIRFGAHNPILAGGDPLEAVNLFEQQVGRRMDLVNGFRKWGGMSGVFDSAKIALRQISKNGRTPLISWEPLNVDSTAGPYTLERIVAGDHDAYITSWAEGLRDLRIETYIRPMHEMNGNWYHWSGNPELYVQAWRHIVDIFDAAGAGNVRWVWCVNASDNPAENDLEKYWPGGSYVDVLAIDGYNCYGGWRSFSQINRNAYDRVCALDTDCPVWVCETATSEPSLDIKGAFTATAVHTKPEWIRDMFATDGMPRIEALLWFNESNPKSFDWRVNSTHGAVAEMKRQLRNAVGYVPPPTPYLPPVPDRVTAVVESPGVVRLSWRIVPSFTRGYRVLRKRDTFELVTTVPKTQTSVRISDLEPGTYSFAVQTYTYVRNSAASQVVTLDVP